MSESVCDDKSGPCLGMRKALHYVHPHMQGEENRDLRVEVLLQHAGDPRRHLRAPILYCPFCGVRHNMVLVHAITKARRDG